MCEQPHHRVLGRRYTLAFAGRFDEVNQGKVRIPGLGEKPGTLLRKAVGSNFVFSSIFPVRNSAPTGLKGPKPMPELFQGYRYPRQGHLLSPWGRIAPSGKGGRASRALDSRLASGLGRTSPGPAAARRKGKANLSASSAKLSG